MPSDHLPIWPKHLLGTQAPRPAGGCAKLTADLPHPGQAEGGEALPYESVLPQGRPFDSDGGVALDGNVESLRETPSQKKQMMDLISPF